jgi:alkanesulfonate monooxygenase SsuD/methylene tetrahydromethanopterin reductase-like flavin-dependent oxidoreductase (luciferase family)
MKVGVSLSILAQPGRSDVAVYKEHLELGDLAEPLGFDSIFALEHHFTGYSMSPAPTQLLSYFAGRVGTPDDCIEQIAELRSLTGTDHLIGDFSYGGMPHEEGELNMRLFADRVVPVLHRDALFAGPPERGASGAHEDVFAPA